MVRRFAQDGSRRSPPRSTAPTSSRAHLWPELGALGLLGITADPDIGGSGMGYLAHVVAMEEISRASASVGLSYGAHSNLCVNQINRWAHAGAEGTNTCRRCARAKRSARWPCRNPAPARTSCRCGSRAEKRNDRYVLNGTKMWITNGPDAGTLVVYAKTDPERSSRGITAFIVEKRDAGLFGGAKARQARHARLQHRRTGVRECRGAVRERAARGRPRRRGADVGPRL